MSMLLDVRNLKMYYRTRRGHVKAVDGVNFSLNRGKALGLVGESGCGKTSIGITLLRILPTNAEVIEGSALFDGTDILKIGEEEMRKYRWKRISMIFQGAMNALNPVHKVGDQIIEAIITHEGISKEEARERVARLFELVGLNPDRMDNYPHEYSGGMRQRAIIAMALACNPDLIIADEPTTALDVIVQDKILREMRRIQRETETAMIYISHDISVIAETCDEIAVMYAGKIVERGPIERVFENPLHPYTKALMSAFPSVKGEKRRLETIPGEPPNLLHPPEGCRFHPRCPYAKPLCSEVEPLEEEFGNGRFASCHFAGEW